MRYLTCDEARELLPAYCDQELSLDDPRDFLRDLALRYANEEAELNEDPDNRG